MISSFEIIQRFRSGDVATDVLAQTREHRDETSQGEDSHHVLGELAGGLGEDENSRQGGGKTVGDAAESSNRFRFEEQRERTQRRADHQSAEENGC